METRTDVVVLGTGVSGLIAAIAAHDGGARVSLFEKFHHVGGTTGLSGGVAWIPNNGIGAKAGLEDSREESLTYLRSLSLGLMNDELVEAFVDHSPEMVEWVQAATPLKLSLCTIPDYHPEHPGGRGKSARSVEAELFSFEELGAWADKVTYGQYSDQQTGDSYLVTRESPRAGGSGILPPEVMAERRKRRINGRGRALVGALLKACLDRGIEPVVNARASELILERGRVTGVKIEIDGKPTEVHASHGVIIATGGFEWDEDLVKAFLRGPMEHPASLPSCTGDGLRMAMRAGAMLGNMREAWWMPALVIPGEERYGAQKVSHVLRERALPGSIIVNRKGKRFCNESTNYNAISGAFHQFDPMKFEYANLPCWLIFDQAYVDKYGFWDIPPGGEIPAWVSRSDDLAQLGAAAGFDGAELAITLARWNDMARAGKDEDFARGQSAYDGWNGDITFYPGAASTLGTIAQGPFYAAQLRSSCLGTKGGAQTDRNGAVLDVDNHPIPGLYAVGNAMAGATGMAYGGAGGTIGPAMVFGFLAGRHVASHPQDRSNQ